MSGRVLTTFVRLVLVDDIVCISQTGFLPLFLHHELHQVLRTHEARRFGVRSVDHVDFLPMGKKGVEMFNFLSSQVSRFGFVALLCEGDVT